MLKFCSISSGSSGNCLFINSGHSKILIDCGISCKKIIEGLENLGTSITDIDAIFLTHEHSDHTQGLNTVSKKFNIPIYANDKTWKAINNSKTKIDSNNIFLFENEKDFHFNDLVFHPFSIPHDASDPCGFSIHNGKKKICIATDLGYMDNKIISELYSSSFLFLESNYDPEILKVSRYPISLKKRISGPNGHLSNISASQTVSHLIQKKDLKEVMLGHLSKENNFPELAYQTVVNTLIEDNLDLNKIKISVAGRNSISKIVNI